MHRSQLPWNSLTMNSNIVDFSVVNLSVNGKLFRSLIARCEFKNLFEREVKLLVEENYIASERK